MKLTPEQRAEVVDELLGMDDELVPIMPGWAAECKRRLDAIEAGESTPVPLDRVMAKYKDRLA